MSSKEFTPAMAAAVYAELATAAPKRHFTIGIGEGTDLHVQGHFVYDSKKAGAVTVSHLRFSPRPIKSSYLIQKADFFA